MVSFDVSSLTVNLANAEGKGGCSLGSTNMSAVCEINLDNHASSKQYIVLTRPATILDAQGVENIKISFFGRSIAYWNLFLSTFVFICIITALVTALRSCWWSIFGSRTMRQGYVPLPQSSSNNIVSDDPRTTLPHGVSYGSNVHTPIIPSAPQRDDQFCGEQPPPYSPFAQ